MLSPDKAGTRKKRVSTIHPEQSDDEITRMCNEQYGSKNGADFAACLVEAIRAINHGNYPERIAQGSSGCYFVLDLQGGYLSEAGASLIDQKLGLNVVPKTAVVSLAAPTFNYSRIHRTMSRTKQRIRNRYPNIGKHFHRIGLPPKLGSFQLFVSGYKDAQYWLRQWELYPELAPSAPTMREFQLKFERMVVLDYIIRNTDRSYDNWLIKYEPAEISAVDGQQNDTECRINSTLRSDSLKRLRETLDNYEPTKFASEEGKSKSMLQQKSSSEFPHAHAEMESTLKHWEMPRIKIAAIDNGLSFPFKHPDQWRAYPFHWANMPLAQKPFSEETVSKILPLIDNTDFVREIGNDLRKIFETDHDFHKKTFAKQMSVMRGQMFNLREALRTRRSPAQLVQMTPQYMIEIKQKKRRKFRKMAGKRRRRIFRHHKSGGPATLLTDEDDEANNPKSWHNTFKQKLHTQSPFFEIW